MNADPHEEQAESGNQNWRKFNPNTFFTSYVKKVTIKRWPKFRQNAINRTYVFKKIKSNGENYYAYFCQII